MTNAENSSTEQDGGTESVTCREFISMAALYSATFIPLALALDGQRTIGEMKAKEIKKEKIRRAMLAGPFISDS